MTAHPAQVVLVDDQPDIVEVVSRILTKDGRFEVVGATSDARQALEIAEGTQPDIILFDLNLAPFGTERLVTSFLRTCPQSMLVALSGRSADRHADRVRTLGAFAYYEKSDTLGGQLPARLWEDHELFRRALAGEDVLAPAAVG